MKLNYIKSQSSVKPDLVDTTSSKVVVYLRQNIVENIKQMKCLEKKLFFMSMKKLN